MIANTFIFGFKSFAQSSESESASESLSGIGDKKPIATSDCDTDPDADAENAFPAALSGSQNKAIDFAGGNLHASMQLSGFNPQQIPHETLMASCA